MVQQDIICNRCQDSCYGDVVELSGHFYHQYCFTCKQCNIDLVATGYFELDGEFFCNDDYHRLVGNKCEGCNKYVEGNAISAVNSIFHPECFGCHKCGKVFPEGAPVVYDGEDFVCETCDLASPKKQSSFEEVERHAPPSYEHHVQAPQIESANIGEDSDNCCAGCGNDIKSGQALLALEKQWHLWCFTCHKCGCLLAGEYMGRDGVPYCEQDYQAEFGVTCAGCDGYITGKVLQAGEKHYHPHCSRCAKCGDMFGEGEEMYLQGSEIWHPHCSEEFQRENEEMERLTASQNEANSPSPQLRVHVTTEGHHQPQLESPTADKGNSRFNGFNHKQPSNSSEVTESKSDAWKPPSSTNTNNTTAYHKPAGFRSVKPPQLTQNNSPDNISDEDEPPPVPPPPSRSSSSAWKQKYSQPAKTSTEERKAPEKVIPYQLEKSNPYQKRTRPISFVESAAARSSTNHQATAKPTSRNVVSINNTRNVSTTSSEDGPDDRDGESRSAVKKGVGFNKLQQRKMAKENSQTRPSNGHENLDPEILRKLNADPHGNTYPYEVLKTDSYKTPRDVDRYKLETYLTDGEFYEVFRMTRDKFYSQPKWKQEELKKRVTLF